MQKLADIISFLFLSSLTSFTGLLLIAAHAQTPGDMPSFTSTPHTTAVVNVEYQYLVETNTVALGEADVIIDASTLPSWLTLENEDDGTAMLSGTPHATHVARHDITLSLTIDSVLVDTQSFTIDVAANGAPTITSIPVRSVSANTRYLYTLTGFDPESDALNFGMTGEANWLTLLQLSPTSARLTGTPSDRNVGSYAVTITLVDAVNNQTSQTFQLTVLPSESVLQSDTLPAPVPKSEPMSASTETATTTEDHAVAAPLLQTRTTATTDGLNLLDELETATGTATTTAPLVSDTDRRIRDVRRDTAVTLHYQAECRARSITDSNECQRLLQKNLNPACVSAKIITPSSCDRYLESIHRDPLCREHGISSSAECRAFIASLYSNKLVCGSLTPEECTLRAEVDYFGSIVAGLRARASLVQFIDSKPQSLDSADLITVASESGAASAVASLHAPASTKLLMLRSNEIVDVTSDLQLEITIPFVAFADEDGDGLPDDLEERYGTNPLSPDTDNDGYDDRTEIQNDYSPLQAGGSPIPRDLSPVERAIIHEQRIEQPAPSSPPEDDFTILTATNAQNNLRFTGTARPDSTALLFIYSTLPLVTSVQTDSSGAWSYDLPNRPEGGSHTAYIAETDAEGSIVFQSAPLSFSIDDEAMENAAEERPATATPAEAMPSGTPLPYLLISGGVLVVLMLVVALRWLKRRRGASPLRS